MVTASVHGFPRIGDRRQLKRATEGYWAGELPGSELAAAGAELRRQAWELMASAGVDLVPSNDFSLYDRVLDAAVLVGAVPERFGHQDALVGLETYFAMARGGGGDATALEMTKWFDTNYHYLVPELGEGTRFALSSPKPFDELAEAAALGVATVPALLGPLTFLLLAKTEGGAPEGFRTLDLVDPLLDVYVEVLTELGRLGADWVRLDEPVLVADRTAEELAALRSAYARLGAVKARPRLAVSTYFGHVGDALAVLAGLPVEGLGLDFCAGPENLDGLVQLGGLGDKTLLAGVVDGRNVWANDLEATLGLLGALRELAGQVVVSTSCSLAHVPVSLRLEDGLDPEVRPWLAFAEEKVAEVVALRDALDSGGTRPALAASRQVQDDRRGSARTRDPAVRGRLASVTDADLRRASPYPVRRAAQQRRLGLPRIPTTTIGSFPQTAEVRSARAALARGTIDESDYRARMRAEIGAVVRLQEDIGLDVLVHGEPERNDMVRYFAEQLRGFAFAEHGWVQSYGTRYVRPPILYGDVSRPGPMTVEWASFAQSLTKRPMKGMLTGPVTMLRWSFVRDDQPLADTARQLALAVRDEVADLEAAGLPVIQVDEAAIREGLPLRRREWAAYLDWAVAAFRLATSAAGDATQIHTHMCYSEFGDILEAVDALDADVTSFEAARSRMELMVDLRGQHFEREVGPGLYDIHSPRVPSAGEILGRLRLAVDSMAPEQLWANPDCGLKTRTYEEVEPALRNLVEAVGELRRSLV